MTETRFNGISFGSRVAISTALGLTGLALPQTGLTDQTTDAPQGGAVETIIVTAQRREQSLQDVGVSVSAVTSDAMRTLGITDSRDIVKAVPGVLLDNSVGGGSVNANLAVRGISQTDLSPVQESPNSIYIDDVYLSSASAASFPLYDLSRVEVLRGPQGTLFGRASSGGLANFITERPSEYWGGYAEAGYSSYNNMYIEGAGGGPISDRARFRLAGRWEKADGWMENTLPGGNDTFEKNTYGVRGQLDFDVTDKLNALLILGYDKSPTSAQGMYTHTSAYFAPCADCTNGVIPKALPADLDANGTGPGNDFFGYRDTDGRFYKAGFNDFGYLNNERTSPTLRLTYDMGDATLTSITNYTQFEMKYGEDSDGTPINYGAFEYGQDLDQFSQELKVNGTRGDLTYTAGFYYLDIEQTVPQHTTFVGESGGPHAFELINQVEQDVQSWALFGQLEYQFTPELRATAGLRYTDEQKDFDSKVYFLELGEDLGGPADPTVPYYDFVDSNSEGLWSGKLQLDYTPTDAVLLYLSASRGVKAAGYNTNLSGFTDDAFIAATPFESESLYAYEGGAKQQFMDDRLRVNASVFYYDYQGFQGYVFDGIQGVVGNYDGHFTGGELEIAAAPTDSLDLNLGVAFLDTTLQDVPTAYRGVRDQEAAQAPQWTFNGSINKRFATPIGDLNLSWDGNYLDDRYMSIDNNEATTVPGSFIHNARVALDVQDTGFEVAAFVKNISNNDRMVFSYDLTAYFGSFLQGYAQPRWYGVSVRKSF